MIQMLRRLPAAVTRRLARPFAARWWSKARARTSGGANENAAPQETFCVLAWNHLQIAPNGTVKMCCIAGEDLHERGRRLNVYVDDYEDIWNSDYMRNARRGMANRERITACTRCYDEEAKLGVSRRTIQNAHWLGALQTKPETLFQQALANDWKVEDRPSFLQLNMGNLCNLACRMCSSQYSSRIANDPVHSRWIPDASPDAARWHGSRLRLGPKPVAGIDVSGFYDFEIGPRHALRWTNGHGVIEFPIPVDARPQHLDLDLELAPVSNRTVRIVVNGSDVYQGWIDKRQTLTVDLKQFGNQPSAKIEVISSSTRVGGRALGVAVHDAWLTAERTGRRNSNARALTRFSENSGWWGQPSLMFDRILGQPEKLRYLILQGGEPLLIPETEDILDYLIDNGCSDNVALEIVSNMTTLELDMLERLKRFARIELGCSIDGIGDVLEYIRYPAKWDEIEKNIKLAKMAPNINIQFNIAVQAYNLLDVPNLLAYCDRNKFQVAAHFLVGPYHLSVLVMPLSARELAADRIRSFLAGDCSPNVRAAGTYVLGYLDQHCDVVRPELMRQFMLFTNDLDRSRGQNFATAQRELYGHIVGSGFRWTDETAQFGH